VWQELRDKWHDSGFELVTVALDANVEVARGVIAQVAPNHPSLIDQEHSLDALLGVVNVPSGVWIDEGGVMVRPPEPAFPRRASYGDGPLPDSMPERLRDMLLEARRIQTNPETYVAALQDWTENGSESRYALPPEVVVERSRPRPFEEALAAAHFELGAYLHHAGQAEAALPHWREAHRLQPDNWTYKRQAWSLADPLQGPTDLYEGDWLGDVRKTGAENYYPPLRM
jgi:hypothetical protein